LADVVVLSYHRLMAAFCRRPCQAVRCPGHLMFPPGDRGRRSVDRRAVFVGDAAYQGGSAAPPTTPEACVTWKTSIAGAKGGNRPGVRAGLPQAQAEG
jgi:hypothetical protein